MLLEEARFVIETHVSYSEESGPAEGGRIGFAIGDRVFWTDAYFNDSKRVFEAKRDYAQAIVSAINAGLGVPVDPEAQTSPAPAEQDAWTVHDPELGAIPVFGPSWFVDVKLKDGTHREMMSPALIDWSKVVAYRDAEIPF